MTRKRQHEPAHNDQDAAESVTIDSAGRVPDTKGDVGFRGGRRPDSRAETETAPHERARPRDTGRQGS